MPQVTFTPRNVLVFPVLQYKQSIVWQPKHRIQALPHNSNNDAIVRRNRRVLEGEPVPKAQHPFPANSPQYAQQEQSTPMLLCYGAQLSCPVDAGGHGVTGNHTVSRYLQILDHGPDLPMLLPLHFTSLEYKARRDHCGLLV